MAGRARKSGPFTLAGRPGRGYSVTRTGLSARMSLRVRSWGFVRDLGPKMADGVKHDYHLVNPSPWPLVGSISATVMALGGVTWLKGMFGLPAHTSWIFFAGLAGVLYTMFGWWRDVVKEANE